MPSRKNKKFDVLQRAQLPAWLAAVRGIVAQIMGHTPNATAEKHYIIAKGWRMAA